MPFFDRSGTPLATLDPSGILQTVNAAFRNAFSADVDLVGKSLVSLVQESQREVVGDALHDLAAQTEVSFDARPLESAPGNLVRAYRCHATRDGEVILLAATPPPPGRAEDELRLAIFDRIIEAGPVAYFATDANGRYVANEGKLGDRLGIKPGSMVGRNFRTVWPENSPPRLNLERTLSGDVFHTSDKRGVNYVDTWNLPLRDANGAIAGAVGFVLDQTERRDSEEALRSQLELAEAQAATIRQLSAPILQVAERILCLPVIGRIDRARADALLNTLLGAIVKNQAAYAIVDLTGVDEIDSSTAEYLVKLVAAAEMLGTHSVLSGIQPSVARSLVDLNVELSGVRTLRTLQDALAWVQAEDSA